MMNLQLEIVTPDKVVLKDTVDEVVVPTTSGEITILPNHAPLLTRMKEGELVIKKSQKVLYFAVLGGFLEVQNNNVNILADYAVRAEDIEVAKAKEAEERAKNAMKQKANLRDFAMAESDLRKAILELKVARRHRRTTPF